MFSIRDCRAGILQLLLVFQLFPVISLAEQASPAATEPTLGPRSFGLEARLVFPEVLGVAAAWRPTPSWQIGVEAARYWVPFWLGETGIRTFGFFAQYHPYQGAFYLGTTLGEQRLNLDLGASILGFNTGLSSEVKTAYVRGFVGWQWVYESGFSWGFRMGIQAPMSAVSALHLEAPGASEADIAKIKATDEYQNLERKVTDVADFLGRTWIPIFSVLHIGWYF